MKTNLNKKQFGYIVSLLGIVLLLGIAIGYSTVPSSTLYWSGGVYPNPVKFTIWREGNNYFAKNAFGQIQFSGTNATEVIQDSIDYTGLQESKIIQFQNGTYIIDQKLSILKYDLTLRGMGIQTEIVYTGIDCAIEIGNGISSYYYLNLQDIRIRLTQDNVVGIRIKTLTYYGQLNRVRVQADYNNTIGIEFEASSDWLGYWTLYNPHIVGVGTAIKCSGSTDKTGIVIFGGYLQGRGSTVSNSSGLDLRNTNTFRAYGLEITAFYYALKLKNSYANDFHGLRIEDVNTALNLTTSTTTRIIGGSITYTANFYNWDTTSANGLNRVREVYGWQNQNTGVAYFNANTTTTFHTDLVLSPTLLLGSFNDTATGAWQWALAVGAGDNVTITVVNAGNYVFTWYAQTSP